MSWGAFRCGLRTVHLWAGLVLCIPLVLLGLSGSILMLQPELPRLALPSASARGEQQMLEHILRAAKTALPDDAIAMSLELPQRTGHPASVRFAPLNRGQGGENARGDVVYVDPVSLAVLGRVERPQRPEIFNTMRRLHATLYVRTISDRSFVGWLGIALVLLAISGLVLWWPRKAQLRAALSIKRGARGFRLHRDLHSAVGFWTFVVILVVSISGVYLAFPRTFRATVGAVLPLGQTFVEPRLIDTPELDGRFTLDAAVALAQEMVPDTQLVNIQLPTGAGRMLVMTFSPEGYGIGAPTILVSAEPQSKQVVYIDDPRTYAIGEQVVIWQRLLHSGLGLGTLYKLVVFVSGFLPLLFAITGIRMWWLKRAQRPAPEAPAIPQAAE